MDWTTANLELENGPTSIEDTELNILNVRGGNFLFQLVKQVTSASLIVTMFSNYFCPLFLGVYILIYTTYPFTSALHVYG
mgnify:CR=1 FL=1